jgi:Holliday junction resolvase RusA-like endonuclease
MINVWVPGEPKTKGSMEHRGGGRLQRSDTQEDGSSASKRWEDLMTYALNRALITEQQGVMLEPGQAVAVRATFWLPTADVTIPRCGDLDKLARAAGDAGQRARLYADDVQIVRFFLDKLSCGPGEAPGVLLTVWAPRPVELARWALQARLARDQARLEQGLTS